VRHFLLIHCLVFVSIIPSLLEGAEPITTTSADNRFVVVSENRQTNIFMMGYIESFFRKFSQTMRVSGDSPHLLRVEIREGLNEKITLSPFMAGNKLCFKITLISPGLFDRATLDKYLAQIAFSAYANRDTKLRAGESLRTVPEWIWLGYCHYQSPTPTTYYINIIRSIYENRQIPPMDRILNADSPGKIGLNTEVWTAFQWLVFRSIYLSNKGAANIMLMAVEDSAGRDPLSALTKVMDFQSNSELQKWWMLQVTHYCENLITEPKNVVATEKKLSDVLVFNLPAEGAVNLADTFIQFRTTPEIVVQLREKVAALANLYSESPPEYQPVILRYQRLFQSLLQDPASPMTLELESLRKFRKNILAQNQKRIDHLNWYIVTKTEPDRREFEKIFRIYENLDDQQKQKEFIPLPGLKILKSADE